MPDVTLNFYAYGSNVFDSDYGYDTTVTRNGQSYKLWQAMWLDGLDEIARRAAWVGGAGIAWRQTMEAETAEEEPAAGSMRFNNATLSAATAIIVADDDVNGADIADLVALVNDSTSYVKGHMAVVDPAALHRLTFAVYGIDTASGYTVISVAPVAATADAPYSDGDVLTLSFVPTGDQGEAGSMSGPDLATDGAWPRFDGAGGATLANGKWIEASSGNVTAGGDLDMGGGRISSPELHRPRETVQHLGNVGAGTTNLDLSGGHNFTITATGGAKTFTVSNYPPGASVVAIKITDGGLWSSVTWPTGWKFRGGTPTLTADGIDTAAAATFDGGTSAEVVVNLDHTS